MVKYAFLESGRAAHGAARHRADVRARHLSSGGAERDQQHGGPDGSANKVLIRCRRNTYSPERRHVAGLHGLSGLSRQHAGAPLNMLAWTIYISLIGVGLLMALPRGAARQARV